MKKKSWKILLICGISVWSILQMIINLDVKTTGLTMDNVEALAADAEDSSDDDCIRAAGRCMVNREPRPGMTLP